MCWSSVQSYMHQTVMRLGFLLALYCKGIQGNLNEAYLYDSGARHRTRYYCPLQMVQAFTHVWHGSAVTEPHR